MRNATFEGPLGQIPPPDDRHRQRYPLTAETLPVEPMPLVIGLDWHTNFDRPITKKRGAITEYWIGLGDLGRVRGGHAVCLKPQPLTDLMVWWDHYDQGREGACVGFATARALSLANRYRYSGRHIYQWAQAHDSWPGSETEEPTYSGTSVRAGLDCVRTVGPMRLVRGAYKGPILADGILRNRWAQSIEDAYAAIHSPDYQRRGIFALLNSWGRRGYPHITYIPAETLNRIIFEEGRGEIAVLTDR